MLTSADIAAQIAAGQQAHNLQLHSSDLLTEALRRTHDPQFGSIGIASGVANTLGAIGMPLGGLALGMMGLDPLSIGMRGYSAARTLGVGFAGSLGAGLATFGLATAGGMALSYGISQMGMGAQQHQHFLRGMQGSYNFLTPTGVGFSNTQLGAIGSNLRQMSGQIGPLGQMVSFEELGQLAQNMGQMGLFRGTQDVTQFTQNFKRMLDSVKHIAKELGGSLQEAQQVMNFMRNSGIFTASGQTQMATEIRNMSIAGGLGIPELNQMSNIGSRVSRMVGGLGAHGAFAGVRTLGQIGMALQTGHLTDEDIYNTTGLRGAEGRQAYAANQLQQSASWLRSGRGRRFLASIAGANGNLDPESINAWNSGDMGIGGTMSRSGRNLNNVGRADFIRNEGRLRGAALAAFGGNIPAMALSQWIASRGLDLEDMDDRSMIFAERQLGMSRDEVDSAVKLLKSMPEQMALQKSARFSDFIRQDIAAHRRTSGMEGVRRKLEAHREHLQNALQGYGQKMYADLVSKVEDFLDKKMGTVVNEVSADVEKIYDQTMKGFGGRRSEVLLGVRSDPGASALGRNQQTRILDAAEKYYGAERSRDFTGADLTKGSMFGTSILDKIKSSGYGDLFATAEDGIPDAQKRINTVLKMVDASRNVRNEAALRAGWENKALLGELYSTGHMQDLKGFDRLSAMLQELRKRSYKGDEKAKELYEGLRGGDPNSGSEEERRIRGMTYLASLEAGAGIDEGNRVGAFGLVPGLEGHLQRGRAPLSDKEILDRASMVDTKEMKAMREGFLKAPWWKKAIMGATGYRVGDSLKNNLIGIGARTAFTLLTGGVGIITGAVRGVMSEDGDIAKDYGAEYNKFQGQYFTSEEGMSMIDSIAKGKDMTAELRKKIAGIKEDSEERRTYERLLRANEKTKGGKLDIKKLEELDPEAASVLRAGVITLHEKQRINAEHVLQYGRAKAKSQIADLSKLGILDEKGELSSSALAALQERGLTGTNVEKALVSRASLLRRESTMTVDELQSGAFNELAQESGRTLNQMSAEELSKFSDFYRSQGSFENAGEIGRLAAQRRRVERQLSRGNVGAFQAMGIKLDRKEYMAVMNMQAGDPRLTALLEEKLGVRSGDEAALKEEVEKRRKELESKKGSMHKADYAAEEEHIRKLEELAGDASTIREKLSKLNFAKTKKEKEDAMMELQNDPTYQKHIKDQENKRREQNDPSLKHLSEMSGYLKTINTKLSTLAIDIANATHSAPDKP